MENALFIARFRDAMALRGYTQTELSARSGVTQVQISNYLKGKVLPKVNSLKALAKALDVSEAWLSGENVPMFKKPDELPDDQAIRVALFGGDEDVSEEEWREVQNFVAYLKSKRGEKN